jgi:hypothetical protein
VEPGARTWNGKRTALPVPDFLMELGTRTWNGKRTALPIPGYLIELGTRTWNGKGTSRPVPHLFENVDLMWYFILFAFLQCTETDMSFCNHFFPS